MIRQVDNLLYAWHLKSGKSKQVTTGECTQGDLTYRVTTTTTTRKYAPSSPFDTYTETVEKKKLLPGKSKIADGSFDTEPTSRIVASSMRLKNGVTLQDGQSTPLEMRAQPTLESRVSFHHHGDAIVFTPVRPAEPETAQTPSSARHTPPPHTSRTFVYPDGELIVSSDSHQQRSSFDVEFAEYHIARSGRVKAEYYRPFTDSHGMRWSIPREWFDATGKTAHRYDYKYIRQAPDARGNSREDGNGLVVDLGRTKDGDRTYAAHCVGVTPPVSRRYFVEMQ